MVGETLSGVLIVDRTLAGSHRVLSVYLERVSLCNPSLPGTCYVAQAGLELTMLPQPRVDRVLLKSTFSPCEASLHD